MVKNIFTSNSMATLTYTDPKGQTQIFNVGDEALITYPGERPYYGKISNSQQWWFIDSKGITVKDLESGTYELEHINPTPPIHVLTPEQNKQSDALDKRNADLGTNMRETYGGKRSRRKSRKSRRSHKSRKYRK